MAAAPAWTNLTSIVPTHRALSTRMRPVFLHIFNDGNQPAALCCWRHVGTRSGREGCSQRLAPHVFIWVVLTWCFHWGVYLRCVCFSVYWTATKVHLNYNEAIFLPFRTKRKNSIAWCRQDCGNGSGNNLWGGQCQYLGTESCLYLSLLAGPSWEVYRWHRQELYWNICRSKCSVGGK